MVLWGKDKEMKEKLLPRETSIKSDNIEIVNEGDQPALNAFVDEDPLPKEQNGEKKLGKE